MDNENKNPLGLEYIQDSIWFDVITRTMYIP